MDVVISCPILYSDKHARLQHGLSRFGDEVINPQVAIVARTLPMRCACIEYVQDGSIGKAKLVAVLDLFHLKSITLFV